MGPSLFPFYNSYFMMIVKAYDSEGILILLWYQEPAFWYSAFFFFSMYKIRMIEPNSEQSCFKHSDRWKGTLVITQWKHCYVCANSEPFVVCSSSFSSLLSNAWLAIASSLKSLYWNTVDH